MITQVMQNPGTDRPATPNNAYCPSVPISVYRELSAELQAAQAMLEVLNNQNQQLLQQNQQFRQEIDKVVQSTQNLQQMAAGLSPASSVPSLGASSLPRMNPPSSVVSRVTGITEANTPRPSLNLPMMSSIAPEDLVIEQEEGRNRRLSTSKPADVNGWILLLAIFLIIITAFGTSFLIIRPLFGGSNNNSR